MTVTTPYKPKSNMITSLSIRKKDEEDYLNLKDMLKQQRISTGEYLIDAYRELDKDNVDGLRLRQLRYSRWALT